VCVCVCVCDVISLKHGVAREMTDERKTVKERREEKVGGREEKREKRRENTSPAHTLTDFELVLEKDA
jgi:hypothetical protein